MSCPGDWNPAVPKSEFDLDSFTKIKTESWSNHSDLPCLSITHNTDTSRQNSLKLLKSDNICEICQKIPFTYLCLSAGLVYEVKSHLPHFFVFYVTQIAVANDNKEAVQLLLEKGFVLITFSVSSNMYIKCIKYIILLQNSVNIFRSNTFLSWRVIL